MSVALSLNVRKVIVGFRGASVFVGLSILALAHVVPTNARAAGVTYHGRLVAPDGRPVASTVTFKIQIRTPGNENCLLYEEQQIKDLSASKGVFAITINDGSATVVNTEPFTLDRIFQNRGTFTFSAGKCVGSLTYSPNVTDGRRIAVEFNDGSFAGFEQMPAQMINFVPMAFESVTVGGFNASSLLRVVDGSGAPTVVAPLTLAQHNTLLGLADGSGTIASGQIGNSSITDAKIDTVSGSKVIGNIPGNAAGFTGSLNGDVTGTQGATTVTKIQGRPVDASAPANGQALVWSAGNSRWEPGTVSGGGGDWSTLTGKPSTFPSDWTTLANKPTSFPSDWSTLTNIPSSFTPSAHTHSVADITSGAGSYLTYQPNGASCSAGEVLKWETAGGGRWICGVDSTGGGGGAVNSVTGTSPVTVNNTDAANPVVSVNASVTSTNNSLVQRDGAGAIQSAGANFGSLQVNNGSSTITLGTPAAFTSYVLKLPSGTGANGQILTSNGTDMVWSTPSYMAAVAPGANGNVLVSNGTSWTSSSQLVATGGNVGIGTAAPRAKLDVNGSAIIGGSSSLTAGTYNSWGLFGEQNSFAGVTNGYGTGMAFGKNNAISISGAGYSTGMIYGKNNSFTMSGSSGYDDVTMLGIDHSYTDSSPGGYNSMTIIGKNIDLTSPPGGWTNSVYIGKDISGTAVDGIALGLGAVGMLIDASGNVGIGTTAPLSPLQIYRDANNMVIAGVNNPNDGDSARAAVGAALSVIDESISLNAVGWGFTPDGVIRPGTGLLLVDGGLEELNIATANTAAAIRFYPAGAESLSLLPNGKVGIGTATPAVRLDVGGMARVQSSVEGAGTAVSSAAAYTIPDVTKNVRRITLTAGTTITLPDVSGIPADSAYSLTVRVTQDATGGRALAWAGNGKSIRWENGTAPAPSSGANKVTIYQFLYVGGESEWFASQVWLEN